MKPRLWLASLVVCALFIGEDPAVVGVRTRFGGSWLSRIGLDVLLAAAMVGYNFVTSRYVVSVASAPRILDAIDQVDAERSERIDRISNPAWRRVRRAVSRLNPFDLIKVIGSRLGRSIEGMSASARHRHRHRISAVVGDLGVVNVLGVPGAGLALSTQGIAVSPRHTLRHCVLFVGSWFVGAHVIGLLVAGAHSLPLVGTGAMAITGAVGAGFALLTDVTQPVGALALAMLTAVIVRYTSQVDRALRSNGRDLRETT